MIKYLLLFLLPLSLFASKILSYNIYDRTDRVDVMITFDTPYEGVIKQNTTSSQIIIKLEDASIESSKVKKLSSKFLHSLTITPMSGYTQITASVPSSVKLQASKTSDAYGLRLRFTTPSSTQKTSTATQNKENTSNPLASLPTKQSDNLEQSYYIVIAILIIGIAILLFIKKRVNPTQAKQLNSPWLFKEVQPVKPTPNTQTNDLKDTSSDQSVSIRFQKALDSENTVVMLDFGEQSYLVLMGKSNILLDKFTQNKPSTQEDFESILQNRHQELDDFLHAKNETKEPLQAYKERAASILYEA